VLLPSSKLDPILRTFRVIKFGPRKLIQRSDQVQQAAEPEKCVQCDVLYDPSPEPIRADVIFIHGLHGSLDKTWKQGIWDVRKVRTVPVRRRNSQPAALNEGISRPRFTRHRSVVDDRHLAGNRVRRTSIAVIIEPRAGFKVLTKQLTTGL